MPRFAVHSDVPAMLFDDAVASSQSQAGTFPGFLGGEERLEEMLLYHRIHATSRIANRQHDIFAGRDASALMCIVTAKHGIAGLNCQFSTSGHGIVRVDR